MRLRWHDRFFQTCCALTTLVAFSIWSMASVMPLSAQAADFLLGLAAGSKEARISLDGKQWAALTFSSNPLYDGTVLRTGNGVASALLKDGTQLELQPESFVGISGSRTAVVVRIAVGRVLFRLPASSRTVLMTPSARYQAPASSLTKSPALVRTAAVTPNSPDQVGEIVVNSRGGSRIGLRQGEMLARPVNDPGLHLVKTGESVYIPQVGTSDPSFKALLAQALPGEAPPGIPVAGAGPGGFGAAGYIWALLILGGGFGVAVAFSSNHTP